MNSRLKTIRKELKLTQNEFGEKIGITGATVSDIERGKLALTDRNISLICEKLLINEEWIRYGTGEMFLPTLPIDEFSQLLSDIEDSDDEFIKNFLKAYWQLDEGGKKVIKSFVYSLVNEQKK